MHDDYQLHLAEETDNLEKVLAFLQDQYTQGEAELEETKSQLIKERKDMWENTAHAGNDFTNITEMNQYLNGINTQTLNYLHARNKLDKYRKMLESPYFGRFDLTETGYEQADRIYLGYANLMDPLTHEIYVYDWRAPISSIYYRYELGPASYLAPMGTVYGDVTLKRQYKIRHSQLQYFFDCSLRITDDILQDILSHNSSPQMRNIVETIQRDQDIIIRDTHNQLLLVQGVAGSGKTSIALHRIAYLLYHGLNQKINSNNFLIISPNAVFSQYISSVLPELGEDNVQQETYDGVSKLILENRFISQSRSMQLEGLFTLDSPEDLELRLASITFKGSLIFKTIMDRLLYYYARKLIPFSDASYGGTILETKQQLQNRFLNNETGIPMAKQLQRLEQMLMDRVRPLHRERLKQIEKIVTLQPEHQLEIKSFSRLLSIKEMQKYVKRIKQFTQVDYREIYQTLFTHQDVFYKLAHGLALPERIQEILETTLVNLLDEQVAYEDVTALSYLKIKTMGTALFPDLKHVVIDEAQDYTPLQYEVFKLLFKEANYTILGDIHQTLTGEGDSRLYDTIIEILKKESSLRLSLNKGYRSSMEINSFTQNLLGKQAEYESFERHDQLPQINGFQHSLELLPAIVTEINSLLAQGYESVAIICKTQHQATEVYSSLNQQLPLQLITPESGLTARGVVVISSYLAKGLEFDAVLVYEANEANYSSPQDKRLLYVASTRALHRLSFYYTGEKSHFL